MSKKPSRKSERVIRRLLWLAPVLATVGCGADFDSPDVVKSLRVLGVRKDHPYAKPTVDPANPSLVNLTMLDYDGTHKTDPSDSTKLRPIQRLWFSGCDNLPGDQYFTCFVRMYALWTFYNGMSTAYNDALAALNCPIPERLPWQDGMSWSPVDGIRSCPNLPDALRSQWAQGLVSIVNPNLPPELAVSYLSTYRIGAGPRFEYPIPPRIVENHQPSSDPDIPPYGLAFIFFTVCAGQIQLSPDWQNLDPSTTLRNATLGFPFICQDSQGNALGSDDFVGGYTQQFVYADENANLNPVIDGVIFNGTNFDGNGTHDNSVYCIDEECVPPVAVTNKGPDPCANPDAPSVDACSDKCPEYSFSPTLVQDPNSDPPKNVDEDTFATKAQGTPVVEAMWLNYYADRGTLKHTVRHLRDPSLPGLLDHDNVWKAPSDPGPANLWAVVHDTRGGTAWVHVSVCVR
jgi:hypothetical protein